jgi:hypothetical protein
MAISSYHSITTSSKPAQQLASGTPAGCAYAATEHIGPLPYHASTKNPQLACVSCASAPDKTFQQSHLESKLVELCNPLMLLAGFYTSSKLRAPFPSTTRCAANSSNSNWQQTSQQQLLSYIAATWVSSYTIPVEGCNCCRRRCFRPHRMLWHRQLHRCYLLQHCSVACRKPHP